MREYIWNYLQKEHDRKSPAFKEWRSIYVQYGADDPGKWRIMEFVRKYNIPVKKLDTLAQFHNVRLLFLAAYWSPSNPVEYVWARLKQLYRDEPVHLGPEERLKRAWAKIDHKFVLACIDRSIRFCRAWHAKFHFAGHSEAPVGADPTKQGPFVSFAVEPAAEDDQEDGDADNNECDDSDDCDDAEQDFKRFRVE